MRTQHLRTAVAVATAAAGLALCGPGAAHATNAAAAHQKPHKKAWHVTIKADKTTLSLGQKVHLTGKVAKSAAGGLVRLYERGSADKPWHYQRNALVHKNGSYATYDKPTVNSARQYRVLMPGDKHHKKGFSSVVDVDVFRWTSMLNFPAVNESYLGTVASVDINGTGYPSSLEAAIYHDPDSPTTQSIEFNLGHQCTRFRGTFGLSDDSETGSQATVTALADGTQWFSQTFGLGGSSSNTQTFATAPLKLRFETTTVVSGADGLGAVGAPEVYCER
ncbi:MAG: hypothetical protein QM747_03130 [Nocardioides sp.]